MLGKSAQQIVKDAEASAQPSTDGADAQDDNQAEIKYVIAPTSADSADKGE